MSQSPTIHGPDVFNKTLPSLTMYVIDLIDLDGNKVLGSPISCFQTEEPAVGYAQRAAGLLKDRSTSLRDLGHRSAPASVRVCKLTTVPGIDIQAMLTRAIAGDLSAFCEDPETIADYAIC